MASFADMTVDQHATWTETTILYEDDGTTLLDLTGYTAALQVRRRLDADSTVLSLTDGSGLTLGGDQGTIVMAATVAQTGAMEAGRYWYDLIVTSGASVTTRVLQGRWIVLAGVTQ